MAMNLTPCVTPKEEMEGIKILDRINTNPERELTNLKGMAAISGRRWKQHVPNLSRNDKSQQMESLINANVEIPDNGTFEFPSSLHNILLNMEKFNLDDEYEKMIKKYKFGVPEIESSFTKSVLEFELNVFEEAEKLELESPKLLPPEEEKCVRDIQSLCGDNASLKRKTFTTLACEEFRNKTQIREFLSLRINDEPGPINILIGKDDIIGDATDDRPSTLRYEVSLDEVRRDLDSIGYNPNNVSEDLKDHEYCDPILYFWRNNMIKVGYVYWVIKEDDILTIHDLTSMFNMKPYDKIDLVDQISADEMKNFRTALGLLYYKCAHHRYIFENREVIHGEIIELLARALALIQVNRYPLIYVLGHLISSNTYIRPDIKINDPKIMYKPKFGTEYVLGSANASCEANKEMSNFLIDSLVHLRICIDVLYQMLRREGVVPLVDNVMPPRSSPKDFNIVSFVKDIMNTNLKKLNEQVNEKDLLGPVLSKSLKIRLMIYCLRKQFLDCLVQARIYQRLETYPNAVMFNHAAIQSWIAMASFWSPDILFPLPLRPMLMLGDTFYRYSHHNAEYLKYTVDLDLHDKCRPIEDLLKKFTTVKDNRYQANFNDTLTHLDFAVQSFECFARCLLYTNVFPDRELLKRLIVVANDLVFTYTENCNIYGKFYEPNMATICLERSELIINLITKLTKDFFIPEENDITLSAHLIRAKHLRIKVDYWVEEKKPLKKFMTIIKEYKAALKFVDSDWNNSDKELALDITTKEMMEAYFECVWVLKGLECADKKSHHPEILLQFNELIELCNTRINSDFHADYFRFKGSVLCACIAEYLHSLYKDENNKKLRNETEFWFDQAITRFQNLNRNMDLLKISADRIFFYRNIIAGEMVTREIDDKTMKVLLKCNDYLEGVMKSNLYEERQLTSDEIIQINQRRVRMNGVLKAFERNLQAVLHRRCRIARKPNVNPGEDEDESGLFQDSLNLEKKNILMNMIEVLNKMKKIYPQFLEKQN